MENLGKTGLGLDSALVPTKQLYRSPRVKRQGGLSWLSYLSSDVYCSLVEAAEYKCYERSILEIWGFDKNIIEKLTDEQILEDVNSVETSAVFGSPTNFTSMLGNIERDSSGRLVKAGTSLETWVSDLNFDKIIPGQFIDLYLGGQEVDVDSFRWEEVAVANLIDASNGLEHSKFYFMLSQGFNEVSEGALRKDSMLIPIGYAVVFVYIQLMLGRFNAVEARFVLSVCGLTSVAMSIVISYGICLTLGFQDTIVNLILPFLLLALGIDDMFVIMQAYNNLSDEEINQDLPTRIGHTMKNAGASILVTSVTDMVAFGIGALTTIPALRSFCIFASVGIATVFILQVTFIVACLKYGGMRIKRKRHSLICCWKKKKLNFSDYLI